ncbi:hypothetical protein CS063_09120 [Sporanaerobium hydrogeniformans]|uniref:Uncharacterized protein n=1 Tax=Sporanaerobium hydrogeniformans TaxID=3072179 RepID=A0AC61DDM8_9FIRM|nr:PilZ domain-containing protein [Sporanaerobium hydrogeniformans]PHV70682.1 hypothetical protein CS063_09120 [Sporanaerobium hydrogeniformans]
MATTEMEIQKSIERYKEALLKDINLKLHLTVKEKTYITKLVQWIEDKLIIEAPLDKLNWVLIEAEKKLNMIFISKSGMYGATVRIKRHYRKKDILYYSVQIVSPLVKKQQRKFFRLDILIPLTYRILIDRAEKDKEILNTLPTYQATAVNISTGGMCLVSKEQLHKGNRLYLEFNFMDKPFELMGEVLFLGDPTVSGNFAHRIRFLKMERPIENLLTKLIFEKQRQDLEKANVPLDTI